MTVMHRPVIGREPTHAEYESLTTRDGVTVLLRVTLDQSARHGDEDELGEVVGVKAARILSEVVEAVDASQLRNEQVPF